MPVKSSSLRSKLAASLLKDRSHPWSVQHSLTVASVLLHVLNRSGKVFLRGVWLFQASPQNFFFYLPLITIMFSSSFGQRSLIVLHAPHSLGIELLLLHYWLLSPYLLVMISFHKVWSSSQYVHNHFIKWLLFCLLFDAQASQVPIFHCYFPFNQILSFILLATMPKKIPSDFVQFLHNTPRYRKKRHYISGKRI